MSKCHIVGNLMPWLKYLLYAASGFSYNEDTLSGQVVSDIVLIFIDTTFISGGEYYHNRYKDIHIILIHS